MKQDVELQMQLEDKGVVELEEVAAANSSLFTFHSSLPHLTGSRWKPCPLEREEFCWLLLFLFCEPMWYPGPLCLCDGGALFTLRCLGGGLPMDGPGRFV